MADPVNKPAALSTSRRKRVLPQQPRIEAKKPRTSSQESTTELSQHQNKRKVRESGFMYVECTKSSIYHHPRYEQMNIHDYSYQNHFYSKGSC